MDAVTTAKKPTTDHPAPPGRTYDGTLRRERAAETRERILVAGSELIHRTAVRDWKKLTVRAVADRAGVSLTDIGPMRACGREALLALGLRDRAFCWPLEMVLKASAAGWRRSRTRTG